MDPRLFVVLVLVIINSWQKKNKLEPKLFPSNIMTCARGRPRHVNWRTSTRMLLSKSSSYVQIEDVVLICRCFLGSTLPHISTNVSVAGVQWEKSTKGSTRFMLVILHYRCPWPTSMNYTLWTIQCVSVNVSRRHEEFYFSKHNG